MGMDMRTTEELLKQKGDTGDMGFAGPPPTPQNNQFIIKPWMIITAAVCLTLAGFLAGVLLGAWLPI